MAQIHAICDMRYATLIIESLDPTYHVTLKSEVHAYRTLQTKCSIRRCTPNELVRVI